MNLNFLSVVLEKFYYSDNANNSGQKKFNSHGEGSLEIERFLLEGQSDCFVTYSSFIEKKQKKIIFCDFFSPFYPEAKYLEDTSKLVASLLDFHFEVYIWDTNQQLTQLQKSTPEDLNLIQQKLSTININSSTLFAEIESNNWTKDSYIILSFHEIIGLFKKNYSRKIPGKVLENYKNYEHAKLLFESLCKQGGIALDKYGRSLGLEEMLPTLTTELIFYGYSDISPYEGVLFTQYPSLKRLTLYLDLTQSYENLLSELRNHSLNKLILDLHIADILPSLDAPVPSPNPIDLSDVIKHLQPFNNLNNIEINLFFHFTALTANESGMPASFLSLSNVITLTINGLTDEEDEAPNSINCVSELSWFLSYLPNLKKLILDDVLFVESETKQKNVNFPFLEYFRVKTCAIDISFLSTIIHNSPNLKSLFLANESNELSVFLESDEEPDFMSKLLETNNPLGSLIFPKLSHLTLENTFLNFDEVLMFLDKCPEASILDLTRYNIEFNYNINDEELNVETELQTKGERFPTEKIYSSISHIILNEAIVTYAFLHYLEKIFPNLQSLSLSKLKGPNGSVIDRNRISLQSKITLFFNDNLFTLSPRLLANDSYHRKIQSSSLKMDADTAFDPRKRLKAQKYFPDQAPNYYFLDFYAYKPEILEKIEPIPESIMPDPFCLQKIENSYYTYKYVLETKPEQEKIFKGKTTFNEATDTQWFALPALSSNDKLIEIEITAYHSCKVSIGFARETGMYFIKAETKKPTKLFIEYIIEPQRKPIFSQNLTDDITSDLKFIIENVKTLDSFIEALTTDESKFGHYVKTKVYIDKISVLQLLIAFFNFTSTSALSEPHPETQLQLIDKIIAERTGSCRHRSLACAAILTEMDLTARVVCNDVHAFVEVRLDENEPYYEIQLGGYPVNIEESTYQDNLSIKNFSKIKPQQLLPSEDNPFKSYLNDTLNVISSFAKVKSLVQYKFSLITVNQKNEMFSLYKEMLKNEKNTFFITDFNHIPFYTLDENLKKVPSSLFQALKSEQQVFLLIDLSHDHHVHHINRLVDHSLLEEFHLRSSTSVVFLLPKHFPSVFTKDRIPFEARGHWQSLPQDQLAIKQSLPEQLHFIEIELYNSHDWKTNMLGRWEFPDGTPHIKQGKLLKAINENLPGVILYNAPQDAELELFLVEIQTTKRFIYYQKEYRLPDDFTILIKERALFLNEIKNISAVTQQFTHPINLTTFSFLFNNYHFSEKGILTTVPGWVYNPLNSFLITEPLLSEQYAYLCDVANGLEHNFKISCLKDIKVPSNINKKIIFSSPAPKDNHIKLIITNDPELFLNTSKNIKNDWKYLHVGTAHYHELFFGYQPVILNEKSHFIPSEGIVLKWLKEGMDVFLIGEFSIDFLRKLESLCMENAFLWINGQQVSIKGRLTLICRDAPTQAFIPKKTKNYTFRDVIATLDQSSKEIDIINKIHHALKDKNIYFNFYTIKNIAEQLEKIPKENAFKPYLLHYADADELIDITNKFFPKTLVPSLNKPDQILPKRLKLVESYFQLSPFICLIGKAGTGKSFFVQHFLRQQHHIYNGFEALSRWATNKREDGKLKVLFFDEATLQKENFDLFENLKKTPSLIFWKNDIFELTPNHKVIFATNPVSYQGRHVQSFFYGVPTIETPTLTNEQIKYILENKLNVIYPEFEKQKISSTIAATFLEGYQFLHDNTSHKPSIRITHSILLKFMSFYEMFEKSSSPDILAKIATYEIVKNLCETEEQKLMSRIFLLTDSGLDNKEKIKLAQEDNLSSSTNEYLLTSSRKNLFLTIQPFVEIRRKLNDKANQAMLYQLPGILLKGKPGVGKTEFVQYFCQKNDIALKIISYSNLDSFKEQIYLAFHQGKAILLDELNSYENFSQIEIILNQLMQDTDDRDGRPADVPGFFVFITINPSSLYSGRKPLSRAILDRCQEFLLEEYTHDELITILTRKLNIKHCSMVEQFVADFLHINQILSSSNQPELTLRDFLDCARRQSWPDHEKGKKRVYEEVLTSSNYNPEPSKIRRLGAS